MRVKVWKQQIKQIKSWTFHAESNQSCPFKVWCEKGRNTSYCPKNVGILDEYNISEQLQKGKGIQVWTTATKHGTCFRTSKHRSIFKAYQQENKINKVQTHKRKLCKDKGLSIFSKTVRNRILSWWTARNFSPVGSGERFPTIRC